MSKDLVKALGRLDLSEEAVMGIGVKEARASMVPFRVEAGFVGKAVSALEFLTCPSDNLKLSHSGVDRVAAYGLSLAPAGASGDWDVCRYATSGCREGCLSTSGNGRYDGTQMGRVWKTKWLGAMPLHFLRYLVEAIDSIPVEAWERAGFVVSFRLNVLSDIPWETLAPWLVERIQGRGIRMYDYTKWPTSRRSGVAGYELCQSASERTTEAEIAGAAHPVVVVDVKRGAALPERWMGRPVVDGDLSDARFLDPAGSVVLLRFKRVDTTSRSAAVASGFVRPVGVGVGR